MLPRRAVSAPGAGADQDLTTMHKNQEAAPWRPKPLEQTFFSRCPHDCSDTCAMLYKVKDGRLIEVRGNPERPFTHGGLCVKLKDYHNHQRPRRL
jgi:anaerobic selenocysteine-containing dehydrogenase